MSNNLSFLNGCIARSSLYRSRLPTASTRIQHLVNNLANKKDSKMLYLGPDLSYALYGNDNAQVHWIDEEDSKYTTENLVMRNGLSEYNLIIASEHMYRTSLLPSIQRKLAQTVIIAVTGSKAFDTKKIIDKSIQNVPTLRVMSRVEICDYKDSMGWGTGIVMYDVLNRK